MSSRFDWLARWEPGPADWNREAVLHLHRRAGFGEPEDEVERSLIQGFDASIENYLARDATPPELRASIRRLLALEEIGHLQAWWMALVLSGGAPLRERLTLMWHDHFATSYAKVDDVRLMHAQNELFRTKGTGDFRELFHAVAKDPAMLIWLDGNENRRGAPNENFAREAMELFGLGLGNYTEVDIREAARGLTGWGTQGRSFTIRPEHHDPGLKEVLGRRGALQGEDVVDAVLEHPACARFVAARLLEEFVHPIPRVEWTDELSRVLLEEDWHVGRTVERLVSSRLFFGPEARCSRIAGPVELLAITARRTDAHVAPARGVEAAGRMGQALFLPPSVKGWDGMHAWLHAGTWIARHNALVRMAKAHKSDSDGIELDLAAALRIPEGIEDRGDLAVTLAERLLAQPANATWLEAVREAGRETGDRDEALRCAAALVWTSPPGQMV